jgi:phosphoribosylformylglycinamidine synthase
VPEAEPPAAPIVETVSLEVADDALDALSKQRLLSLDRAEMKAVQAHFREPQVQARRRARGLPAAEPTDAELEIVAQTWSEHCKHKEFNALILSWTGKPAAKKRSIRCSRLHPRQHGRRRAALAAAGNNWLVRCSAKCGRGAGGSRPPVRLQGGNAQFAVGAGSVRRRHHGHPGQQP